VWGGVPALSIGTVQGPPRKRVILKPNHRQGELFGKTSECGNILKKIRNKKCTDILGIRGGVPRGGKKAEPIVAVEKKLRGFLMN